ncbi:uncharacterized protein [Aegilops tauschii subsp. strangulata]|uniref:uncharacterized protein n=1 Tax=Aegilops tauschii subsp. strangulata TaxID=200361 RepID=UPI003CC861B0
MAPPLSFAAAPSPHPSFRDSIQNHIKFLLNPDDHNYHKWKSFFLLVLIRHGVTQFIEQPLPPNATAFQRELDAHLVLWIYSTLADNLVDHVVGATTAYDLWHRIRDYFLANCVARYMMLNRQYRNLKQGDLSIAEYARRMKLLTVGLADIEHAVTEFLHGIDKRLDTIRVVLGDTVPLPPFETVFSRMKLAEENLAQRVADEPATILAVTGSGGPSSSSSGFGGSGPRPVDRADRSNNRGPTSAVGHGSGNRGGRGRGRGRGHGRGDHGGRGSPPPMSYNPYMGFFAPYGLELSNPRPGWVPPNAAGVLGPQPGSHAQAYPMQFSSYHAPTPPAPPSWDHLTMLQAAYSANGISNNGSAPHEWYLDSGTSSHVTGNPGYLDLSNPSLKPFSLDLRTRRVIMISASSGDLYPFFGNNKPWSTALSATTSNADRQLIILLPAVLAEEPEWKQQKKEGMSFGGTGGKPYCAHTHETADYCEVKQLREDR